MTHLGRTNVLSKSVNAKLILSLVQYSAVIVQLCADTKHLCKVTKSGLVVVLMII